MVKVKEPIAEEYKYLRQGLILFTYLHLAADEPLTQALLAGGTTAIAYETVQLEDGSLPLLLPMSEVAGRMAPQVGAAALESGKNLFETKAVSYVYSMNRRPYPSDVSEEEWAFVMPYLTLLSGRKPAKIRPAGSVQRLALDGKNRCPVGVPAPRLPPTPHRS